MKGIRAIETAMTLNVLDTGNKRYIRDLSLPNTQAEEGHELNLLGKLHLELHDDRNGKREKDGLGEDLIYHRQIHDGGKIDAFRSLLRLKVPGCVNWKALEDCESDQG